MNGVAIGYNNQAVIEMKQNNPEGAIRLSEESVLILETPVFN
jgi:hypothetical protein